MAVLPSKWPKSPLLDGPVGLGRQRCAGHGEDIEPHSHVPLGVVGARPKRRELRRECAGQVDIVGCVEAGDSGSPSAR